MWSLRVKPCKVYRKASSRFLGPLFFSASRPFAREATHIFFAILSMPFWLVRPKYLHETSRFSSLYLSTLVSFFSTFCMLVFCCPSYSRGPAVEIIYLAFRSWLLLLILRLPSDNLHHELQRWSPITISWNTKPRKSEKYIYLVYIFVALLRQRNVFQKNTSRAQDRLF